MPKWKGREKQYHTEYMREYRRSQREKLGETIKKALSTAKPGPLNFREMLERIEASPNQFAQLKKELDSLGRYHKTLLKKAEEIEETLQKLGSSPMNLPALIENMVANKGNEKDLALTHQSMEYVLFKLEKIKEKIMKLQPK